MWQNIIFAKELRQAVFCWDKPVDKLSNQEKLSNEDHPALKFGVSKENDRPS